jgi:hypothetical protein
VSTQLAHQEAQVMGQAAAATPMLASGVRALNVEEVRDLEMRSIILSLKSKAANKDQIAKVMREQYGLSREQTIAFERDALHELALRCKEDSPFARAEQVFRIRSVLTELHNPPPIRRMVKDETSKKLVARMFPAKKNWQAIARFEQLLMEVEGNHDQANITVNIAQNTLQVFQGLSDARRAEYLDKAKERMRLADMARTHLPPELPATKTA